MFGGHRSREDQISFFSSRHVEDHLIKKNLLQTTYGASSFVIVNGFVVARVIVVALFIIKNNTIYLILIHYLKSSCNK